MRMLIVSLLLVLGVDYSASMWVKKYVENYHRPTYYNKAHHTKDHVDYNREALEKRDEIAPRSRSHVPLFNPLRDISYYVNVLHLNSMICSGALISHRMVITSTHCFNSPEGDRYYEYKARDMGVVSGNELSTNIPHSVISFYMPAAGLNKKSNYVALLALENKLGKFNRYIKLHRGIPKSGDKVLIAFLDPKMFKVTHMETVVLNYDRCQIHYSLKDLFHVSTFEPYFICVRNNRHTLKTTCSTRPGDPLIVGNMLAAINVYGEHCDEENDSVNMDIYLPMRHVIKFIQIATDALRAATHTGPFNDSLPTTRSPMIEFLLKQEPSIYIGHNVNYKEDYSLQHFLALAHKAQRNMSKDPGVDEY